MPCPYALIVYCLDVQTLSGDQAASNSTSQSGILVSFCARLAAMIGHCTRLGAEAHQHVPGSDCSVS